MHAVGGTIMDRQMSIEPERNSIHTIVVNRDNPNAMVHYRISKHKGTVYCKTSGNPNTN